MFSESILPDHTNELTHRERQVLKHLAEGKSDRYIAAMIGVSERQYSRVIGRIGGKIGRPTHLGVVAFAATRGIEPALLPFESIRVEGKALTRRQCDFLRVFCQGVDVAETAKALGISRHGVKMHKMRLNALFGNRGKFGLLHSVASALAEHFPEPASKLPPDVLMRRRLVAASLAASIDVPGNPAVIHYVERDDRFVLTCADGVGYVLHGDITVIRPEDSAANDGEHG